MEARIPIYLLCGALLLPACGGGEAPRAGPADPEARPAIQRTLTLIALQVPTDFAGRPLGGGVSGRAINIPQVIFNAGLVTADDVGNKLPVLAEGLPRLNTDSWRVFPDGTMETTYRLKPNLTWHDGQPLTAEDFVFGWQVYSAPDYGVTSIPPVRYTSEVMAPDARAVVIKWTQRYVDAGILGRELSPLPRHLLEQQHAKSIGTGASSPDFLPNSPFWNTGYVGAGPYKVDAYSPGVSIEASAFDAFVLGRPRINSVSIRGIADVNTALATILAGEAHMSFGHFTGETGEILLQHWGTTGGTILWEPTFSRTLDIQFRPERAQPLELATDVRVRQAIAHAIDKEPIFEAVAYGRGFITDTFTPPQMDIHPLVDRAVAKYPYDPRRVQQLLEAAGSVRGSDGKWTTPRGTPFDLPIWYTAGATNFQQENEIMVDQLNRLGIAATSNPFHTAGVDRSTRELLPGMVAANGGASTGFLKFRTSAIATPENRWVGGNRGYSNPAMDRLTDAFDTALDPAERTQLTIQMEKIVKEDLPTILLYYTSRANAHVAALKGPANKWNEAAAAVGDNIHEWYWES